MDGLALDGLGFQRSELALTGRPPCDPRDLLKSYIYGYVNRICSSRRLEREAHRNIELMWLIRKLQPDFKTIADFRRDNARVFTEVFRQFILLCREMDLFGGELLAIDVSKFKAVNSKHRNFTKGKLTKRLEAIDAQIDQYLSELDAADEEEADIHEFTTEELWEKIQQLKERRDWYEGLRDELEVTGESQVSLTDHDSRSMPKNPKVDVG